MVRKIVLATVGSLGDVHPFIAIGRALKAAGAHPVLAVPRSYAPKVFEAGLEASGTMPDFLQSDDGMSLEAAEVVRRCNADPDFLIRQVLLRSLDQSTRTLDELANGAALIVGSVFAFSGEIVAKKRGIPFVPAYLQPLAMHSARDPPRAPGFAMMAKYPATGMALIWNKAWRRLIAMEIKRRYGAPINRVRSANGLAPLKNAPLFDLEDIPPLRLALFSRLLGPDDPEALEGAVFTGFPVFDSDTGRNDRLDAGAEAFLQAGDAPVVFTLGSVAIHAPGDFFAQCRAAAKQLGRRAILLTGQADDHSAFDDALVRAYLPHSQIFRRSAAIVHHGGIGTTGQALMAGRPQIVVPHVGDQWDNAYRIERLGVGRSIPAENYTGPRAEALLKAVLSDQRTAFRAQHVGDELGNEHGAEVAADAILGLVR
jgi:rhamnosyltransferase subunit B